MASVEDVKKSTDELMKQAASNVLVPSDEDYVGEVIVRGHDFDAPNGLSLSALLSSLSSSGMTASALGEAIVEVNRMIDCKLQPFASEPDAINHNPLERPASNCTIFLSYTSNQISSGNREVIKFLAKHNMVDSIVTTAGGIEEDFIKCLAPFYMGSFELKGCDLRKRGLNRIGNLLVPNKNYCLFEDWILPIFDACLDEKNVWTPMELIHRLGKEINNEDSVYYWCWKNNIPVFCPALTDGSIGDMLYFHSHKRAGFVLDILADLRRLNTSAVFAKNTGMIILGGGVIKHHVCNANLMRNGADFTVFVNTASEFDGSDSGARPDEAVSWGKIRATATPVKVHCDATLAFPLIVAETFAKRVAEFTAK